MPNIKAVSLVVSGKKIFSYFTYINLGGQFWPQGHNLNTLGIGPQGDPTNKISRL